jgi:hypothetical protein
VASPKLVLTFLPVVVVVVEVRLSKILKPLALVQGMCMGSIIAKEMEWIRKTILDEMVFAGSRLLSVDACLGESLQQRSFQSALVRQLDQHQVDCT